MTSGIYGVNPYGNDVYTTNYLKNAYGNTSLTNGLSFAAQPQYDTFEKKEGSVVGSIAKGSLVVAGLTAIGLGIASLVTKKNQFKNAWGKLTNLFSKGAVEGGGQGAKGLTSGLSLSNVSQKAIKDAAENAGNAFNSSLDDFAKISSKKQEKALNRLKTDLLKNQLTNEAVVKAINDPKEMTSLAGELAKKVGKEGDKATIEAAENLIKSQYKAKYTNVLQELANAKDVDAVNAIINKLPQDMQEHIKNGQGKLIKHILSKSQITGDDITALEKMGVAVEKAEVEGGKKITKIAGQTVEDLKKGGVDKISQVESLNNYRNTKMSKLFDGDYEISKKAFEANKDYYNALVQKQFGNGVTVEATEQGFKINGLDKLPEASKTGDLYQKLNETNQTTIKALKESSTTWTI